MNVKLSTIAVGFVALISSAHGAWEPMSGQPPMARDARMGLTWTVPSVNEVTIRSAEAYCKKLGMRLPSVEELREAQERLDFSQLPGFRWGTGPTNENQYRGTRLWSAERGWAVDAIPVLTPVLAIPYPTKSPYVLHLYTYRRLGETGVVEEKVHYTGVLQPNVGGRTAQVTCVGR
jgi:hypothetical protein